MDQFSPFFQPSFDETTRPDKRRVIQAALVQPRLEGHIHWGRHGGLLVGASNLAVRRRVVPSFVKSIPPMNCSLFNVRQNIRHPAMHVVGCCRERPIVAVVSRFDRGRELLVCVLEQVNAVDQLLDVVLATSRRAASRAACTAGRSSATNTPMMAITTSSSTRVKPRLALPNRSPKAT